MREVSLRNVEGSECVLRVGESFFEELVKVEEEFSRKYPHIKKITLKIDQEEYTLSL
jgi:hypothetical protein